MQMEQDHLHKVLSGNKSLLNYNNNYKLGKSRWGLYEKGLNNYLNNNYFSCRSIAMIFFTTTVSPESIAISEVNIGDEKILIKGSIAESGSSYSGEKIWQKDGVLYINIKSKLINFGNSFDKFNISLEKKDYGDFSEVVLIKGDNKRTIWSK